jgi:hypothetical protein
VTKSRSDTARVYLYTLRHWWYSRGPWTHITAVTVFYLAFCATVAHVAYPYLERAMTT